MSYQVREVFNWTREGFSPRSDLVVEHEGFERNSCGFRIYCDGEAIFTAYPPFATRDEANARVCELPHPAMPPEDPNYRY